MRTTHTREAVSERRKRIATATLLVSVFYALIHWGLPLLVHENARDSLPLFGFMASWPSWIVYGIVPLDLLLLISVFSWSFKSLDGRFDDNDEAPVTAWNFTKLVVVMFGPIILLFLVSSYGWFSGMISAVLFLAALLVFGALVWSVLRLAFDGVESLLRVFGKLGDRLTHSGIGHHVTNYLNAADIPEQLEELQK